MPSKNYALEPGGPERVGVSWEGAFKNLALTFDGALLREFATAEELHKQQSLALPDGSRLEVRLAKLGPFPELRIGRDGFPLPGSAGDPTTQLAGAANVLFVVAALNVGLGLLVAILDIGFLKSIGVGWASVLTGVIYAGLAALVKRRSSAALGVAVALFVFDGLYMFVVAAEARASPPVGGPIARIFFLMPMLRGFSAIRELKKPRRRGAARPARPQAENWAPPTAPLVTVTGRAPTTPAAKTFTGDAEKRRLAIPEETGVTAVKGTGRKVEVKGSIGVDAAGKALRFVAHKVEIGPIGLSVTLPSGQLREVPFITVTQIVARQLPVDPPWDGAIFIDVIPAVGAGPISDPVRVFGTTTVNYAAIKGGGTASRLENTRRLIAFLKDSCPSVHLDEATAEFMRGPKVPLRFANMTQFLEYDTTYG